MDMNVIEPAAAPAKPGLTVDELLSRIVRLLNHCGDRGQCKACGEPIFWLRSKNGRPTPFTLDGLVHFANCSGAAELRKTKKGEPSEPR